MKVIELFGGIGSPRAALEKLGVDFEVVDYVEIDESAVRSYNAMYGENYEPQDIVEWDKDMDVDLIFHGSPCQDFSMAGYGLGGDKDAGTRSSLMWHTVRIVDKLRPTIVIWENVKSVLFKNHIDTFNAYIDTLSNMGYNTTYKVLNSMDFGVPQNRDRIFVVSILDGEFNFDTIKHVPTNNINNYLEETRDYKYLVTQPSMLKQIPIPENIGEPRYGYVRIIDEYVWTISTKQVRSPNAGVIDLGDGTYRYLTERETWRLMGFSDEQFDKALSANPSRGNYLNTQLYKQAGNSIVVDVLVELFRGLFNET